MNASLLALTDAITDRFTIDEFWWDAILAAIVLSIVTLVLELIVASLLRSRDDRRGSGSELAGTAR